MGNGVEAEWGSGCFGTEFCFQGRERRPVEGEEKNQKMGGLVDVPLVCRIEGGGERLLWAENWRWKNGFWVKKLEERGDGCVWVEV